jgi:predicted RNase H-like HicB family nuclease
MELALRVQAEELPEGLFLATSDELPGLVAQGRTVAEALDIARDVARRLIEARRDRDSTIPLPGGGQVRREYTVVVAA